MTPDERRAALVEKVARAMCIVDGFDPDAITDNHTPTCPGPTWRLWADAAAAALTVALEEVAQVAQSRYMGDNNREDMEARRIAAAIRALIPGSGK
ncbi:MAG: hypothetical protein ABFD94_01785 [Armatimonadia bacterium]